MPTSKTKKAELAKAMSQSLDQWNEDKSRSWSLGSNYDTIGTEFETFVNKYLFPKISETKLINTELGNRFNFAAKDTENIAQLNEEYVILDSVPVDLNLSKEEELMLKRNYPRMATKLYGQGVHKKQKFTLNDNSNRLNWSSLSDAIKYSTAVYRKKISDINVDEEAEIRAMLIDYGLNHLKPSQHRYARNLDELSTAIFEAMLNLQNNSSKYNEADTASGGALGRYTTQTELSNMLIITTDRVKTFLLDTKVANTFQIAGLDFTNHVISFDDLGGVWKLNEDVTVSANDIDKFRGMGDYQVQPGDKLSAGVVFTFDISEFDTFKGKVTEIKPDTKNWAMIIDVRSLYYERNTDKLAPTAFYNNEMDEYTYWMHYYSFKAVSPFYNKLVLEVDPDKVERP